MLVMTVLVQPPPTGRMPPPQAPVGFASSGGLPRPPIYPSQQPAAPGSSMVC